VADLVPSGRRATAYGLFAGVVGAASLAGGTLTGGLYGYSIPVLITVVVAIQVLAVVLLAATRVRRL
ncbi:MFS transporter, partial [Streptomyces carpinensis]